MTIGVAPRSESEISSVSFVGLLLNDSHDEIANANFLGISH
jgi:hypothetical protein